MKKLVLILLTFTLITACENEPLDSELSGENPGGGDGGSESDDLTLSLYELDIDLSLSFFGLPIETVTNSDLNISNDKLVSGTIALSLSGSPFETENQVITRNGNGLVISDISVNSAGETTNEYLMTYSNGHVSQITYDYYEDDFEDYVYNFTHSGNLITRTEVGSTISTEFTIDGFNRVIKKESFDNGTSIQIENITYSGNGNINSSTTSGEVESNVTYSFDDNPNPLQIVYSDNYLLNFLADDYSDEIGPLIAQFHSTNNWKGASFNGEAFTFDLEYNSVGRIINRDIVYDFGDEFSIEINEKFSYIN